MGVVEPCEDLRLRQVGRDVLGGRNPVGVGHLDGDVAPEVVVVSKVHPPEAARAEAPDQAVAPDGLPVQWRGASGWVAARINGTVDLDRRAPPRENLAFGREPVGARSRLTSARRSASPEQDSSRNLSRASAQRGRLLDDGGNLLPTLRTHSDAPPSGLRSQARVMRKVNPSDPDFRMDPRRAKPDGS